MTGEFLNAVNDEIERLELELSTNLTFKRWRELNRVRDLYAQPTQGQTVAFRWNVQPHHIAPVSRRIGPERIAALALVRNLLRGREYPTPTREILHFLEQSNVQIPGKEPVSNLSAMLSNSNEFRSHGRSGWTYVSDEEEEEEEGENSSIQDLMDEAWR